MARGMSLPITDNVAEHVVNCGGLWAREVGRMVGLELPVLAMEHHYLITEDIPGVIDPKVDKFHVIDFEGEDLHAPGARRHADRHLRAGVPAVVGTGDPVGLRPEPAAERPRPHRPELETAFEHFPELGKAGIRKIVNGPFTFAPDGNPLIGPVKGLKNFWVACGVMAGFSQGGGVGLALANWMIDGDPGHDVWGMDVSRLRRLGDASLHQRQGARELFAPLPHPLPQRGAAGGAASPHLADLRPNGRVERGDGRFLRPRTAAVVRAQGRGAGRGRHLPPLQRASRMSAAECRAVRANVGMTEISNYGKIEVEGPGAAAFLNQRDGEPRARRRQARAFADAQRAGQADRRFHDQPLRRKTSSCSSARCAAEDYYMRWFERRLPSDGVHVPPRASMEYPGLSIAGPKARELLQKLVREDVSNAAFPFLSFRKMDVGRVPALVGRVSFTGELGYEIWVRPEYQRALLRNSARGGRVARAQGVRHARAAEPAAREELRHLVPRISARSTPPMRRGSAGLSISRRTISSGGRRRRARRRAAASCACRPSRSTRATPTRSATSRSGATARSSAG